MSEIQPTSCDFPSDKLDSAGFTSSGKNRFRKTVSDYQAELYERSVKHAEVDMSEEREVTLEHVKAAAYSIANSFGRNPGPKWIIYARLGQFICAAGIGVAGNHLDKFPYGPVGFIVAFGIGAILFVMESSRAKQ